MSDLVLTSGFQYAGYVVEATICLLLIWQGRWRRLKGLCLYVAALFLLDGVARSASLSFFGVKSTQYFYFYWLTDVVLALGAFLLVYAFFRRACAQEDKMWRFVRLVLVSVFVLVLGVSALKLTSHYSHLTTTFITEFSQDLYFSCLVLNTMLYVMIQQFAIDDEELGLLVCGVGVQFAGGAAGLALIHLTTGQGFARQFFGLLNPACTLGMLLIWIYAIVKVPQAVPVRSRVGKNAALLEAIAD
ncbi:MAG TPA: hypothetical protein VEN79_16630 [Terriglobia bacterium]|nr:hypothetical protein [Terriglobia bacterium]